MQDELDANRPDLAIDLLIVNETGYSSGNETLFTVTDLPVLQDDTTALVWTNWQATWRDLYIVDANNNVVAIVSLTTYGLSDPTNYTMVYDLLIDAAGG